MSGPTNQTTLDLIEQLPPWATLDEVKNGLRTLSSRAWFVPAREGTAYH
ncbi:MAG: hypothetical protein SFU57_02595 [Gemmatimonadales bacterium]|nr:hypothetical protein [Gemmatimonadales bacterium]